MVAYWNKWDFHQSFLEYRRTQVTNNYKSNFAIRGIFPQHCKCKNSTTDCLPLNVASCSFVRFYIHPKQRVCANVASPFHSFFVTVRGQYPWHLKIVTWCSRSEEVLILLTIFDWEVRHHGRSATVSVQDLSAAEKSCLWTITSGAARSHSYRDAGFSTLLLWTETQKRETPAPTILSRKWFLSPVFWMGRATKSITSRSTNELAGAGRGLSGSGFRSVPRPPPAGSLRAAAPSIFSPGRRSSRGRDLW